MNSNLSSYYTFYIVASSKNISQAAKKLYISQPAVSKSIAKLEESLGTSLFLRSSKGVELTPEGKILFEKVSQAFISIELGEEQLRLSKNFEQQHLTIGVSTTLCKYILLPYLKDFIHQNPQIKVSISCQSSFETLEALQEGKIDIGLIGETVLPEGCVFKKTHSITDIFVSSKSYLEHQNLRLSTERYDKKMFPKLLENSTLMLMEKNNLSREYIDKYVFNQNISTSNIIEVSTMDLLIEFSIIGLGIACVIKEFVKDELKNQTLIEIETPYSIPKRNIGFVYNKKSLKSAALSSFLKGQL